MIIYAVVGLIVGLLFMHYAHQKRLFGMGAAILGAGGTPVAPGSSVDPLGLMPR